MQTERAELCFRHGSSDKAYHLQLASVGFGISRLQK